MGSRPITFLWLWPATDHEAHCQHVDKIDKIRSWTESTPRSRRWRNHMAGIYSDCSTCVITSNFTRLTCGVRSLVAGQQVVAESSRGTNSLRCQSTGAANRSSSSSRISHWWDAIIDPFTSTHCETTGTVAVRLWQWHTYLSISRVPLLLCVHTSQTDQRTINVEIHWQFAIISIVLFGGVTKFASMSSSSFYFGISVAVLQVNIDLASSSQSSFYSCSRKKPQHRRQSAVFAGHHHEAC